MNEYERMVPLYIYNNKNFFLLINKFFLCKKI